MYQEYQFLHNPIHKPLNVNYKTLHPNQNKTKKKTRKRRIDVTIEITLNLRNARASSSRSELCNDIRGRKHQDQIDDEVNYKPSEVRLLNDGESESKLPPSEILDREIDENSSQSSSLRPNQTKPIIKKKKKKKTKPMDLKRRIVPIPMSNEKNHLTAT